MSRIAILNFHGLGAPARDLEPGEAPYWLSRDRFREVLDLIPDASVPVALTFDDGNVSDLEIAAPILAERGLVAESFVLSDRIGAPGSLSAEGLRALETAGWRIGTHGAGHNDWRRLSPVALDDEIAESRRRLEEMLGRKLDAAAIPFGSYAPQVLDALRRAGLTRVMTSDGGLARAGAWLMPRITVRIDTDLAALSAVLTKREPVARRLRRAIAVRRKRGLTAL